MADYQTAYTETFAAGVPGMVLNTEPYNGISRTAEAAIQFAAPVSRGTGDHGVITMAAAGTPMGIAIRDVALPAVASSPDQYPIYHTASIMTRGMMWVLADAAVADGGVANWNSATNRWTSAATSGSVFAVKGAEFDTTATAAGQLVRLRYDRDLGLS